MYKKIILSLSALIIFSLPYQQQYVEGAILSKVATKGAQKIVKEIIQDAAVETAMNFVLDQKYKIPFDEQDKYQKQAEYELFCGKKMPDLITCEKPMQVKAQLTEVDKANIKNQSGIELEKLITGGKGLTKWQKFLDWFLPIWAVSFALTAITYALDDDVRDLFNNAGYNALLALGIIKEVTVSKAIPIEDMPLPQADSNLVYPPQPTTYTIVYNRPASGAATFGGGLYFSGTTIPFNNLVIQMDIQATDYYNAGLHFPMFQLKLPTGTFVTYKPNDITFGSASVNPSTNPTQVAVRINGQEVSTGTANSNNTYSLLNTDFPIHFKKVKSIQYRTPYEVGGFWYTDVLFRTVDGNIVHIQAKDKDKISGSFVNKMDFDFSQQTSDKSYKLVSTIFTNQDPLGKIIVPSWEELEGELDPMADSNYKDKYDRTTLMPPSALPYTKTSTGETLEPIKVPSPTGDPTGDTIEFRDPQGNPVPEDDITVGDPVVTPSPNGTPQVQPPATPSNPAPQPINLSPPNTAPPIETEAPIFPEGEGCSVGLKLPRFVPLFTTMSDAFPFSIPFDLKDGFDAIFAEMGNEKPEFDYKFNFMGEEQSWKISIPDYFDDWKAFTDSFLIFIFDVGIIYAIYRFMGGGN